MPRSKSNSRAKGKRQSEEQTFLADSFSARMEFALSLSGLSPGQFDKRMRWRSGWTRKVISPAPDRPLLVQPAAETVERIADVLQVSANWLKTGFVSEAASRAVAEIERQMDARSEVTAEDRERLLNMIRVIVGE